MRHVSSTTLQPAPGLAKVPTDLRRTTILIFFRSIHVISPTIERISPLVFPIPFWSNKGCFVIRIRSAPKGVSPLNPGEIQRTGVLLIRPRWFQPQAPIGNTKKSPRTMRISAIACRFALCVEMILLQYILLFVCQLHIIHPFAHEVGAPVAICEAQFTVAHFLSLSCVNDETE